MPTRTPITPLNWERCQHRDSLDYGIIGFVSASLILSFINPKSDKMKEVIKDDLTYKIIGCAMKVHGTLGNGFQEVIYQRALAMEFEKAGLGYAREKEQSIFYDGVKIGTRRADFLVEDEVLVELKAVIKLEDVHLAQGLNYLVAYHLDKGLLLNFGAKSLEVKRLKNPRNSIGINQI